MEDTPKKEAPSYRSLISWGGLFNYIFERIALRKIPDLEKKIQEQRQHDQGKTPPVGTTAGTATRPTITPPPPSTATHRPYSTGTPNKATTGGHNSSASQLLSIASAHITEVATGNDLREALKAFGFTGKIEEAFDSIRYNGGDFLSDGKVVLYKGGFEPQGVDLIARAKAGPADGLYSSEETVRRTFDDVERRVEESQVVGISPCVKYDLSDDTYCTLINDEGLMTIINGYTLFTVLSMAIDIHRTALFTDSPIAHGQNAAYLHTAIAMRDLTEGIYGAADLLATLSPRAY